MLEHDTSCVCAEQATMDYNNCSLLTACTVISATKKQDGANYIKKLLQSATARGCHLDVINNNKI